MRSRWSGLICVVTAVAAAAMLAACGTASGSTAEQGSHPPIVVGISLSLSGGFVDDGLAFERGYRLWQSDVNSRGGILGRPVHLVILNDNSDPKKVVANYNTLIKVNHVDMTLGPFSSLLSAPAADAVAKYWLRDDLRRLRRADCVPDEGSHGAPQRLRPKPACSVLHGEVRQLDLVAAS